MKKSRPEKTLKLAGENKKGVLTTCAIDMSRAVVNKKECASVRLLAALGIGMSLSIPVLGGVAALDTTRSIDGLFHPPEMSVQDKGLPQCNPNGLNACSPTDPAAVRFIKYHPLRNAEDKAVDGAAEIAGVLAIPGFLFVGWCLSGM